jgi:site-specific recombinase XerC
MAQMQKAAPLIDDLLLLVAQVDDTRLIGVRDRTLLLLGFASALRRSELVGLDAEDVRFEHEGVLLTVWRSKTDHDGRGVSVALVHGTNSETCTVRALHM